MSISDPVPKNDAIKRRFEKQKRRDTKPELDLRRELHRRGLRYRVDWRPPIEGFRSRIDVAFTKRKLAVFVDGCFWHGCPEHMSVPKNNRQWWVHKITANRERDERTTASLIEAGWLVIRFWEHEEPSAAAERIEEIVR